MSEAPILVSACLLGQACRYDGGSKLQAALVAELGERALSCCPEEAGGLGTPRPKAALVGGDGLALWQGDACVVDENGRDRTRAFQRGAVRALARCLARGARGAIFKERSPSCGTHEVWIGGSLMPGLGVTAALFQRAGLPVEALV